MNGIFKRILFLVVFVLFASSLVFLYTYYQNQKAYVMVIDINGEVISTYFSGIYELRGRQHLEVTSSQNIVRMLDFFSQDKRIKAFILRINATDGQTVGQEEIVREIKRTEKPVIAVINGSAFSAGYYIAAGSDKIYAEESSSIGDIAYNYVRINKSKDAEYQDCFIPSTKYKEMSSEDCPDFDSDVFYKLWHDVDITHTILLDHISGMRQLDGQYLENLTHGQIFNGKEALELGLIDEIGGIQEAILFLEDNLHENLSPIYLTEILEDQRRAAVE